MVRRIDELATIEIKTFTFLVLFIVTWWKYRLSYAARLVVFVNRVSWKILSLLKKLLPSQAVDILEGWLDLNLINLSGILTDRAPAMVKIR